MNAVCANDEPEYKRRTDPYSEKISYALRTWSEPSGNPESLKNLIREAGSGPNPSNASDIYCLDYNRMEDYSNEITQRGATECWIDVNYFPGHNRTTVL